jgi:hypothetical protein
MVCSAALHLHEALILTSIRKGMQLSLIRANRRAVPAPAHAFAPNPRVACGTQSVMHVAERDRACVHGASVPLDRLRSLQAWSDTVVVVINC